MTDYGNVAESDPRFNTSFYGTYLRGCWDVTYPLFTLNDWRRERMHNLANVEEVELRRERR